MLCSVVWLGRTWQQLSIGTIDFLLASFLPRNSPGPSEFFKKPYITICSPRFLDLPMAQSQSSSNGFYFLASTFFKLLACQGLCNQVNQNLYNSPYTEIHTYWSMEWGLKDCNPFKVQTCVSSCIHTFEMLVRLVLSSHNVLSLCQFLVQW